MLEEVKGKLEFKGKQGLFKNQSPQTLKNLIEIATIQSVESLNRIGNSLQLYFAIR
jgi:hypothetical protein